MRRLLLLNWRDPWHPDAGGAELFALRLAEGLIGKDWSVEWFTAMYSGALPSEVKNGITFRRKGSPLTVHLEACRYYGRRPNFDYVVDSVNTIPFFTPLYCSVPKVALFWQLAREVWFYESAFPANIIGYLSEPVYLQAYSKMPIITISISTALSLRQMRLSGPISVLPVAVDEPLDIHSPVKDPRKNVVVLCRLRRSKRIEECIKGAAIMVRSGWTGSVYILGTGSGSYRGRLEKMVSSYGLEGRVSFLGRVSDAERTTRLKDASAIWMTSVREGWGLVITEAARNGTPAVVYDVPGLRDSVVHNKTGFVVAPHPEQLAVATRRLFDGRNPTMSVAAIKNASHYSWQDTVCAFENALLRLAC